MDEVDERTLESEPEPEFCIDASSFGNVARFINHSCDPNLFVQCILSSHHDVRLARIVLFAADDIPRMQVRPHSFSYYLFLRFIFLPVLDQNEGDVHVVMCIPQHACMMQLSNTCYSSTH